MYQIGDIIFYGNIGVCRVTDITMQQPPNGEAEQQYYTLVPLYQQCLIHIPVDSDKVFMRPAISKEDAKQLIDLIPTMRAESYHGATNHELAEHYEKLLRSHDCVNLIELTTSIYAKKQELEGTKRKFGVVDERFLHQAEELLFGELAVALEIPVEEVSAYIAARMEIIEGPATQQAD